MCEQRPVEKPETLEDALRMLAAEMERTSKLRYALRRVVSLAQTTANDMAQTRMATGEAGKGEHDV